MLGTEPHEPTANQSFILTHMNTLTYYMLVIVVLVFGAVVLGRQML